jgi:hypothetical protein
MKIKPRVHVNPSADPRTTLPWMVLWPGIALTGVWAFAEASVFFLVPDIPLSLAAMYCAKRIWRHVLALTFGAVLAGVSMFHWAAQGEVARAAVQEVPRVQTWMFVQAQKNLAAEGGWAVVKGPAAGIPYKIYAVLAPSSGVSLPSFAAASVPARAWRPVLFWAVFSALGWLLTRFDKPHWRVRLWLAFWATSMVAYWLKVG